MIRTQINGDEIDRLCHERENRPICREYFDKEISFWRHRRTWKNNIRIKLKKEIIVCELVQEDMENDSFV